MSQNFVKFCSVTSPCESWQRSSIQYLRGRVNMKALFLAVCGQKFMKFRVTVGTIRSFQRRSWLSIACIFPKIFAMRSRSRQKRTKVFGPNFSWGMTLFYGSFSAIRLLSFIAVWSSFVHRTPCAKRGNEAKCRICIGWVLFFDVCGPIRSAVFPQYTGQTDRQTDRSFTGKFDDYSPLRL